jgi:hypothetical protein
MDVVQYAVAALSSKGGEALKEDLCKTLGVSLLDSPSCIAEKLVSKSEDDQFLECVLILVKLLVNGLLPPPELCSSILGIFLEKDGNDLTIHLLGSQTADAIDFGKNLGKLSEKVA